MSLIRFNLLLLTIGVCLSAMTPQASLLMKSFHQFGQSPYSDQLKELVQIKLETGAQVDEVLKLIQELLDSLKSDQFSIKNISELEDDLSKLNTDLANANVLIQTLAELLVILRETIITYEKQLSILNEQEQFIRNARAADVKAYNRRVESANKVINALNLIIQKLSKAVDEQTTDENRQAILAQIHSECHEQFGPNHPITILVKLTTRFDVPTVQRILEKLEQIRDAATKSLNEDIAAEEVASTNFDNSMTEIETLRKRLSTDLENLNQQFNDKFNQQKIVLAQKEQLLIDIPITEELLQLTKEQKEQYHQAYISRQTQRLAEIDVVQKAYNLVFDHVDSVKKSEDLTAKLNS
ncbi:unnamed protein product (macronuclear) [Paramecium tetraurelia]|uniref:Trichocyst matrix protein n=1 Tax=Paramecium tetraurelia TaxID=5888 RepID=A0BBA9_PARTE|nr:uncharacterized protein GSPATT00000261001 [Paramecium tetraurelia]CAK55826.1 unnamed protein product [Paramecium tetraurelia]|eukprot:XP_001423224.1 hypothetical protein (macronuclear) [Paramecium tetraurelia strain d4-2]